jgi:hypothetical protein
MSTGLSAWPTFYQYGTTEAANTPWSVYLMLLSPNGRPQDAQNDYALFLYTIIQRIAPYTAKAIPEELNSRNNYTGEFFIPSKEIKTYDTKQKYHVNCHNPA